ncbi:conjugal transfer protein TrbA [Escherichia coli]|nr:conjugal transfer protein TrbA [Escherichia coli]MDL8647545.1 conjugal transfer protein TrbA [Escherichia coli]MDL8667101.1 conjugal transfer protein TrbA [Escherichia coli]MDL8909109.1 conjugal transfer protein TrbA [Escherichia coli]MDL8970165.1 conjugal transfer protein TrbA [Escherichia coli]
MGSCAAPSAKGDDKFITTDYLQQCPNNKGVYLLSSFVFFVVNVISVCMLPDNFLFLCGAVMNQCAVPVVSMAVSTIPVITKFDSFRRMFVCIMLSSAWSGVMWFFIRGLMTG